MFVAFKRYCLIKKNGYANGIYLVPKLINLVPKLINPNNYSFPLQKIIAVINATYEKNKTT